MNRILSIIMRPLCWLGWHPLRSATASDRTRCDICGRFVKGGK